MASVGLRTGYRRSTSENVVANATQDRLSERRTIPVNVDLALTTEWSLNYSLTLSDDERRDPTGVTFGDRTNQTVQITGRLNPLTSQGTFRNPIRVSLRVSQDRQEQCRILGGQFAGGLTDGDDAADGSECDPFTDLRIRNLALTVGTDIPPFSIGLQASWRDTQSELGQRPGSTQLEISLFGQFLFETGEIR